jgi:hypothetical protein
MRDRDFDSGSTRTNAPEIRRRAMAQCRTRTTGRHGSQVVAMPRNRFAPNRIHAPAQRVQPSRPGPAADGGTVETELPQLRDRNDTVLPPRECREFLAN